MNRPPYYLSLLLLVVGIVLLVAAVVQDFGDVAIFDEPPWMVGVGLATIGGLTKRESYRTRSPFKPNIHYP